MNHKMSQEKFEAKVAERNPNFEVLSQYNGYNGKVTRRCKICGDVREVSVKTLLEGHKCKACLGHDLMTTEEFKEKMKVRNPNIILLSEYTGVKNKVKVKCLIDGHEWEIKAGSIGHRGCPECRLRKINHRTDEEFREELAKKYPRIQLLSKFTVVKDKVKLKCEDCGYEWETVANTIINCGKGCPKCNRHARVSENDLIERLAEINPHIEYIDGYTTVRGRANFKCKICGAQWSAQVDSIINGGCGCPGCKSSKGERRVENYFLKHNIKYIPQYTFDDCRYSLPLRFDFFLPDYNVCVEYDGLQHTKPVSFGSSKEGKKIINFEKIQARDKVKNDYCTSHNIDLIRIFYTDFDNVEIILDKYFSQKNWKRIFGIAGKIGQLDQRGTVHTYQDYDNNAERVHIMLKDYQYTYVISDIDRVAKITFSA